MSRKPVSSTTVLALVASSLCALGHAVASPISISETPLFLNAAPPPQVLMVMGRDHTLYYAAYNDVSDLTGNGVPDVGYKPDEIDYLGLFDSFKCYTYGSGRFTPDSVTADKQCNGQWSGDFLNYLTTSRMDALRVVLYGGTRSTDTDSATVLERVYIPQDSHSWGKEYTSVAVDGYDISDYTPYAVPLADRRHLFASTSLLSDPTRPRLRVLRDQPYRIWEWVSIERPVAGNRVVHGGSGPTVTPTDFTVRVEVCVAGLLEANCKAYTDLSSGTPTIVHKPTGLLHDFGEGESMFFGLLTGSYEKSISGGVLRKNVASIRDEINADTGQFTNIVGVIRSIDRLAFRGFQGNHVHNDNCGWIANRPINEGECRMWGNPVAEMMYEAVRYFAGRAAPTAAFDIAATGNDDAALGLPRDAWLDPYRAVGGVPHCAIPVQLTISDINPSYDSNQLPGSTFSAFGGDNLAAGVRPALDVSALADDIWAMEYGAPGQHFIGESGAQNDGAPTPKTVNSFNIRGLAPEEPTKLGSYYAASVARYGRINDIRPELPETTNMRTFVVALASNLPRIQFPLGNGTVSIIPYGKSPFSRFGGNVDPVKGQFQPTNTIVSIFVQELANIPPMVIDSSINAGRPYAVFRINFEDVEQGADHDMDAIVRYELTANADGSLTVDLRSEYAAGSIEQHLGYVVSGTTQDGLYLEVRDCDTANPGGNDPTRPATAPATQCTGNNPAFDTGANAGLGRRGSDYYLGTPNWGRNRPDGTTGVALAPVLPSECDALPGVRPAQCAWGLPLSSVRTFEPSGSPAATLLQSPLWYAAKYGLVEDPTTEEWDSVGDGNPDNYFLVTNPARLREQMAQAFRSILALVDQSALSTNSTRFDAGARVFQARFSSEDWSGDLVALRPDDDLVGLVFEWSGTERLANQGHGNRKVFTRHAGSGVEFDTGLPDAVKATILGTAPPLSAGQRAIADQVIDFLRGDDSNERSNGGLFRDRSSVMGDIINSEPVFSGAGNEGWTRLAAADGGGATGTGSYGEYLNTVKQDPRSCEPDDPPCPGERLDSVYVGANDGMLHAFDAQTGEPFFSYVPSAVHGRLRLLAQLDYSHRFYVDGRIAVADARFGGGWKTVLVGGLGAGGRGIYALDITRPQSFDEDNVLWELTPANDPDIGHVFGKPAITQLENGTWVVIFGNGYNSASLRAHLFVVRLSDGQILHKLPMGATGANGLSGVGVWMDPNTRNFVSRIYAGDLLGTMWRIDFTASVPAVAFADGLFTNPEGRAITSEPALAADPSGGVVVYYGSGKLIESDDRLMPSANFETFWAVRDQNAAIPNNATGMSAFGQAELDDLDNLTRTVEVLSSGDNGWFLNLRVPDDADGNTGERVLGSARVIFGRVLFSTFEPQQDACSPGGIQRLYVLNAISGAGALGIPGCLDCGGVTTGEGAPIRPPVAIRPKPPAGSGGDFDPDDPVDPGAAPPSTGTGRDSWCSEFGFINPATQEFETIGTICDGRQVWRQIR